MCCYLYVCMSALLQLKLGRALVADNFSILHKVESCFFVLSEVWTSPLHGQVWEAQPLASKQKYVAANGRGNTQKQYKRMRKL